LSYGLGKQLEEPVNHGVDLVGHYDVYEVARTDDA